MDERIARIKELVAAFQKHQDTLGLSDRAMVARFKNTNGRPLLGSTKTWKDRLLAGDFSSLNLDRWLANLTEAHSQLFGGARSAKFFEEMPFTQQLYAELERLEGAMNDRRCLVCLAPTGVGKSVCINYAVAKKPASRIFAAAHPGWRDSLTNVCCGLIAALGEKQEHYFGGTVALEKLTTNLSSAPRTIFIDEAHDGGTILMRVIRHCIDRTPVRFVYCGYPTEFDTVRSATAGAITEAQQFLGRCQKPVFDDYRDGTKPEDVAFYLHEALGFTLKIKTDDDGNETSRVGDAVTVANQITQTLHRRYNLRLLDDAVEQAEIRAGREDKEVTPDLLVQVIERLAALPTKGGAK